MNYLKNIRKTTISNSILYIVIGVILIAMPDSISDIICYVIGSLGIIFGLSRIINYYNLKKNKIISNIDIILGISSLIFGIIIISSPKTFASIIPFVIGIYVFIIGYFKFRQAYELKDDNYLGWKRMLLSSLVTIILGVVVIFNPFETLTLAIRIVGIVFVLNNLYDLYNVSKFK